MTQRRLSPPLAPLAVALVSFVMAWTSGAGDPNMAINPVKTTVAAPVEPARAITLPVVEDQTARVEIVQARPLLAQGRRVPDPISQPAEAEIIPDAVPQEIAEPVPEPAVEPAAPPPPDLHMVGVMQVADNMRVLLRNQADQSENWYMAGDEISGWTLVEITQDAILLRTGEAEITIKMFE